MPALSPKESAAFVTKNARHVSIDDMGVEKLANEIAKTFSASDYTVKSWKSEVLTPKVADERAVDWIFVTDLLNFSFWSDPKYEVHYNGQNHTGYWALCAAVNRAIEEGLDILDPRVCKNISEAELRHVFRPVDGRTEIPLFNERLHLLHEAGHILLDRFEGRFSNVVAMCNHSAVRLIDLLCEYFPSFRDTAHYQGEEVSFLKRAQILVGDLWSCFEGQGMGYFTDIEEITAFADYRIPQVLVYFNVLRYDAELCDLLHRGQLIPNGSEWEVEIRGTTLHAIELIVSRAQTLLKEWSHTSGKAPILCNAILVDNFLWTYRRKHVEVIDQTIPMHKTRCCFY